MPWRKHETIQSRSKNNFHALVHKIVFSLERRCLHVKPNNILPDLGSVLTAKDDAEIKAQSTRQGRCEQLLDIIPRKGPNAFKVFVEALKEEAPHLASDLIDAGNNRL